jgi:hypothetical protein
VAELNARSAAWLQAHVHPRPHRATGVAPAARLEAERGLLAPLPRLRYDTSERQPRHLGRHVPLVEFDGVLYSVPPELVGWQVEVRAPVDSDRVEVLAAGRVVAAHRRAAKGSDPVWSPEHRAAAEAMALKRVDGRRRRLHAAPPGGPNLQLPGGDYDVDVPDLGQYSRRGDGR